MAPLRISLVFGLLLASALALPKKKDDEKAEAASSSKGNFSQPQIQPGHTGGFDGFDQSQIQPGHVGGFGQPIIQPGQGGGFEQPIIQPGQGSGSGQPLIQPGQGGRFEQPIIQPGQVGRFGQSIIEPGQGGGFSGRPDNQGFGQPGGFTRPQTATCRYWCNTPEGQAYCCESSQKSPKHPLTSIIKKSGNCPVLRPDCPVRSFGFPVRSFGFRPPNPCSKHGDCAGADRCCFDRCLTEHVCKAPLYG